MARIWIFYSWATTLAPRKILSSLWRSRLPREIFGRWMQGCALKGKKARLFVLLRLINRITQTGPNRGNFRRSLGQGLLRDHYKTSLSKLHGAPGARPADMSIFA